MSTQKINTKTVRDAIRAKMSHVKGKITVIKRDNAIVVRQDDGGSMRQVKTREGMLQSSVRMATGLDFKSEAVEIMKNGYTYIIFEATYSLS